ncbi:CASP8 and FADD-like apoptosis regulator [Parambassis ranga]|uniref:CASP8 and FADD-like apoptosis regulator n=1 Tax=Parambassis ranga TaxID=210632 RepID=A0A6P7KJ57_9TELE|nr:CASP8 and FADD-like apoptosis regulator [Parambassis ranga]
MALLQDQLREINQIAEDLNSCERKRLLYLCDSMEADSSVARVKEMLRSKILLQENSHLFLRELMLRLGRFDILRKVCKVSKDQVERDPQVIPRFRVLMANISEDLDSEDLDSLKFLLSNTLTREKIENSKNFLDVIIELEKMDSVSPERVDFIVDHLKNIGRVDLAKKVAAYKTSVTTGTPEPPEPSAPPQLQQTFRASQSRQGQCQPIARVSMNTPVRRAEQNGESSVEAYKFNTYPRGVCVIIDCVGSDGGMLSEMFTALHFDVVLYQWLSAGEILTTLKGILNQRERLSGDGFVCCIISRGTADCIQGTDSYANGLPLDTIRRLFTGDECPMLAGKPKIFFIQRYSIPEFLPVARMDYRDEDLETDGYGTMATYDNIPADADVFWSQCWTAENQLEQQQHHSIYFKALADSLHKARRRKMNLVDVHTEVNAAIFEHNRWNPGADYHIDVKHTLRKNLYLE